MPDGFTVSVFARGLGGPRIMAIDDDGVVYVTRPDSGDAIAFSVRDGEVKDRRTAVRDLEGVHGVAVHDRMLYVVTEHDVYRRPLRDGASDSLQQIVSGLPDAGQHPNRTLAIGPDSKLDVSVTCRPLKHSSAGVLSGASTWKRRFGHVSAKDSDARSHRCRYARSLADGTTSS